MNRSKQSLLSRAAAAALCTSLCPAAWAEVDAAHRGGEWWQWALSIPAPVNPLMDATGQNCMVGQRGATWYLAGSFLGGAATRSCTVPQGVTLYFPVANYVFFDSPGICGQGASFSVAEMRAIAAAAIDPLTQVSATIDGKAVRPLRRIKSKVFATVLPADNVFLPFCGGAGTVPAGVYSRSVDDGYYGMVEHLSVGPHTLQISVPEWGLDVVYTLTVVPRDGN